MADTESITGIESRVAQLVGNRLGYARIATALGLTPEEARTHVYAIAAKLTNHPDAPPYYRVFRWVHADRFPYPLIFTTRTPEECDAQRFGCIMRRNARQLVRRALTSGRLVKPSECPRCGRRDVPARAMHGHHPDHTRPLDVEWMCMTCHMKAHRGRATTT